MVTTSGTSGHSAEPGTHQASWKTISPDSPAGRSSSAEAPNSSSRAARPPAVSSRSRACARTTPLMLEPGMDGIPWLWPITQPVSSMPPPVSPMNSRVSTFRVTERKRIGSVVARTQRAYARR